MGLVARDAELVMIAEVLDREPTSVRALVLEGEPGVGKTSLAALTVPVSEHLVDHVASWSGSPVGGRIGLASWTPEGFVGGILRTVGAHVSPPPGAQPATRWGTEDVVAGLLGDGVSGVRSTTATVTQRFIDGANFADLFLTYHGPTFSAAGRLDDQGRAALRADLVTLAESHDRGEGDGLVCDWEYRIVTAMRR